VLTVDDQDSHDGPPATRELSRRQFLQQTGVTAGGVFAFGLAPGLPVLEDAPAATAEAAAPAALRPGERITLRAILARLLPADELGPGAVEAGVDVYIDRALAGAYAGLLPLYRQNLAAIDAAAKTMGATSFAALSPYQQDTLLQQVEAGKVTMQVPIGKQVAVLATQFFQVLLQHMREGMFGDPMYGGNRSFAGWDLIGYPGIKLVWAAQEQALGTRIAPAHTSDAAFGGHLAP
jgi:gluconate 2-dehydrogenase gamma chain